MNKEEKKEYHFDAVLVFFVENDYVYLARKKKKIGAGLHNGYGGEIERVDLNLAKNGISPAKAAAVREVKKECDVMVLLNSLQLFGVGYFTNIKDDGRIYVCKARIFVANKWFFDFKESSEMSLPQKFNTSKLPFDEMIVADRYWLWELLMGRKMIIRATMRKDQTELVGKVETEEATLIELERHASSYEFIV